MKNPHQNKEHLPVGRKGRIFKHFMSRPPLQALLAARPVLGEAAPRRNHRSEQHFTPVRARFHFPRRPWGRLLSTRTSTGTDKQHHEEPQKVPREMERNTGTSQEAFRSCASRRCLPDMRRWICRCLGCPERKGTRSGGRGGGTRALRSLTCFPAMKCSGDSGRRF